MSQEKINPDVGIEKLDQTEENEEIKAKREEVKKK